MHTIQENTKTEQLSDSDDSIDDRYSVPGSYNPRHATSISDLRSMSSSGSMISTGSLIEGVPFGID